MTDVEVHVADGYRGTESVTTYAPDSSAQKKQTALEAASTGNKIIIDGLLFAASHLRIVLGELLCAHPR